MAVNPLCDNSSELSSTIAYTSSDPSTPTTPDLDTKPEPSIAHSYNAEDFKASSPFPVDGWPKVAAYMAKTPDFASFGRFRELNIKSLIYYQAELWRLRDDLHNAEWRDRVTGTGGPEKYAKRACSLIKSPKSSPGKLKGQWEIIQEIRKVLKEYNEALLQYTQICALPAPEPANTATFYKWLTSLSGGNGCISGKKDGEEQDTWGPILADPVPDDTTPLKWQFLIMVWRFFWPRAPPTDDLDLVATRSPPKADGVTRWLAHEFVPFHNNLTKYKDEKKRDSEKKKKIKDEEKAPSSKKEKVPLEDKPLSTYSHHAMARFSSSFVTVLACLLPTVAITVLSKIHGLDNLLICLAAFATAFSIGLIFLATPATSRVEIFTATAAFSAVLVVFISTPSVSIVAPQS